MPLATIDLVGFNAGGGHHAAADAMQRAIEAQGWPWRVRKVMPRRAAASSA